MFAARRAAKIFGAVFINKLIIRLFDYSVFAASERTDSAREGDAKILFNFEWPKELGADPAKLNVNGALCF